MKAGIVGALFMTPATLGRVSSGAYADPNAQGKKADAKATKVATITPVKPTPTPPACGSRGEPGAPVKQNYVFNFQKPEHYHYEVKEKALVSGTSFPANGDTITIAAVPDPGYTFRAATASWDYTLTRARCGGQETS